MPSFYADPPDAPWALLARHLAAEATAAERATLRAWVQADPAHLQILTTVTRAWERAGEAAAQPPLFSAADVQAAWQRFRPLMQALPAAPLTGSVLAEESIAPVPRRWPAAPGWPTLLRVAAGFALVLGAGYLLANRGWLVSRTATTVNYVSTGSRRFVRLPDGSRAWLNAHSRLHYAGLEAGSGGGRRAVQLTGEAYFEVVHDAGRPFVVSTTTARVQVTGTAFNVRAYAAEDSAEVSVTQGRVWVIRLAATDSVLLTAGTRTALHAADAPGHVPDTLRPGPAADANFRAWQTDTLRFVDAPVAQVARTLQASFGTRLALSTTGLRNCRFTGTFPRPRPGQVLAVMAAATGSQLIADERGGYLLRGVGCAPRADTGRLVPAPAIVPAPAVPAPAL